MSDKKLLILGASGVTGQHLVQQALERNHSVTALVSICVHLIRRLNDSSDIGKAIDMATFGEYFPSVVTRDSPCWIPGTGCEHVITRVSTARDMTYYYIIF